MFDFNLNLKDTNLENLKIIELKEILKTLGMPIYGKKHELVQRIKSRINDDEKRLDSNKNQVSFEKY